MAVEEVIPAVLAQLAHGPYLLGEHFSAADVLYGTSFAMFSKSPLLPKSPRIDEYVTRIVTRPAFARAMAKEGA